MGLMQWLGFSRPAREEGSASVMFTDSLRDSGQIFHFGMTDAGERVDERSALQIAAVFACVRLLADSVAQLPLNLFRKSDAGSEPASDHPLQAILNREPNPEMSSYSYFETMMMHLLLWGNHYSQIVRDGRNRVTGLYPLLPENVEVDRGAGGEMVYIYHAYTDEKKGETGRDFLFRRDEILHIPNSSFNGLVGFSPIAMEKNALGSAIAVEKYGSAFFRNGAQPSGVLTHPDVLKNPDKIRKQWNDAYGNGAAGAHRVAVLEEGVKYTPISLPPEDSQFLSTREYSTEEICRIFNVPPHLVQDLRRATFNNIEHMSIDFVVHSLDPWLKRIEQGLSKDLLLDGEKGVYFPKFNVNGFLRGDYESRMRGYATAISNGIVKINEVRALEDMNSIPEEEGGNYHLINGGYSQLKDAGAAYAKRGDGAGSTEEDDQAGQDGPDGPDGQDDPDDHQGPPSDSGGRRGTAHERRHEQRRRERRQGADPGDTLYHWIPCDLALPAQAGQYLVTLGTGMKTVAGYDHESGFGGLPVKAWMPVP